MPPRQRDNQPKGRGKGTGTADESQKEALHFGYPAQLVTALQAIASRSTAGLFKDPVAVAADQSVQQLAQSQANVLDKLGKRINGNLKAKASLQDAATAWMGKIGQHLAALTTRLSAVAARLDQDQAEAISALQQASVHLEASAQEQVDKALGGMGPVSGRKPRKQRFCALQLAYEPSAQLVVATPQRRVKCQQAMLVSSVSATPCHPALPMCLSLFRGRMGRTFRRLPDPLLPVELWRLQARIPQPNADGTSVATGAHALQRVLAASWTYQRSHGPGWPRAHTRPTTAVATPHGRGGAYTSCGDAPLYVDLSVVPSHQTVCGSGSGTRGSRSYFRAAGASTSCTPSYRRSGPCGCRRRKTMGCLTDFCSAARVRRGYGNLCGATPVMVRRCAREALALPMLRQGLVTLAHAASGHIYSVEGFGPSTAQEWLFPAELLAQEVTLVGHLPATWESLALRVLATMPCPLRRVPEEPDL